MIEKPPHGAPCNSCGMCCRHELCPLAHFFFKLPFPGQCPALEEQPDGRGVCGLVAHPAQYAPVRVAAFGADAMRNAALRCIGSGFGCDALADGERPDAAFRSKVMSTTDGERRRTQKALALWVTLR